MHGRRLDSALLEERPYVGPMTGIQDHFTRKPGRPVGEASPCISCSIEKAEECQTQFLLSFPLDVHMQNVVFTPG